jgi:hypothetical protein
MAWGETDHAMEQKKCWILNSFSADNTAWIHVGAMCPNQAFLLLDMLTVEHCFHQASNAQW